MEYREKSEDYGILFDNIDNFDSAKMDGPWK